MKRIVLFDFIIILSSLILSSLISNIFSLSYFMPNVLLVVVIVFSIFEKNLNIVMISLILGILSDCTRGTSFGLSTMSFLIISYVLCYYMNKINEKNFFISFLLTLIISIIYSLVTYSSYLFIMKSDIVLNEFILITLKASLGNLVLFIPIYISAYFRERVISNG